MHGKVVRCDVPRYLIDTLDVVNTELVCVRPDDFFGRRVVDAVGLHCSIVGDDDVAVLPGDLRIVVDDDPLRSPVDLRHVLLTDVESALDQEFGHGFTLRVDARARRYGRHHSADRSTTHKDLWPRAQGPARRLNGPTPSSRRSPKSADRTPTAARSAAPRPAERSARKGAKTASTRRRDGDVGQRGFSISPSSAR